MMILPSSLAFDQVLLIVPHVISICSSPFNPFHIMEHSSIGCLIGPLTLTVRNFISAFSLQLLKKEKAIGLKCNCCSPPNVAMHCKQ